jgi:glucose/arabinose dehydrogenase
MIRSRVVLALAILAGGCGDGSPAVAQPNPVPPAVAARIADAMGDCRPTSGTDITLFEVARGLKKPVHALAPAGDPRLFIVEQPGRIRILAEGAVLGTPFLDVTSRVTTRGSEQGLLGLAFHPNFAANGRFFIQYTDLKSRTVVAEHRVDAASPNVASRKGTILLRVDQPYANHNAGEIAFSPTDGMLYIGLGDGGAGRDPHKHGRNPKTLLGSILRIDVDSPPAKGKRYAIPKDNPWADGRDGLPEIWAIGLRNPWRFSFDVDGSMYIGDVGQNAFEEIDHLPAGVAGADLGWSTVEGDGHCHGAPRCDQTGLTQPVLDYKRTGPCDSVTGGFVYRGSCMPDLVGTYFYADYCDDWVRSFVLKEGRATQKTDQTKALDPDGHRIRNVSSFGRDGAGELYVIAHRDGRVFKIVPAAR